MLTGFEAIDEWYLNPLGKVYLQRVGDKLNELISNLETDMLALDAGCGAGHYTLNLAKRFRTVGVDKSEILIDKAIQNSHKNRQYINFVVADISSLPFQSNSFHIITCLNVIEFVQNQEETILELKRVLAPNGVLILGVCNKKSIWGVQKLVGKRFRENDPFFNGTFFTKCDIIDLVKQEGLKLEQLIEEIYFPPIKNTIAAKLFEIIGKRFFKSFPGIFIASMKKKCGNI
jgi:ubiquinone/menaquinone biosynthesis C-methylase UbiE